VESRKPAYNAQQLEECDLMPDDSSAVIVFDGNTHNIVQQVIQTALYCYRSCIVSNIVI